MGAASAVLSQPSRSNWLPWVDVAAIAAWGALMLHYWHGGRLALLIHPAYHGLVVVTGFLLLMAAANLAINLVQSGRLLRRRLSLAADPDSEQHISLLPKGWATLLLLLAAIGGFLIAPQPLTSHKALQRGIGDPTTAIARAPKAFRSNKRPEQRSLIEWVRTLEVYPEPEAYRNQPVNISGFVTKVEGYPADVFWISRFTITCCAADAYPIGLPVRRPANMPAYPPDTWLEIQGRMAVDEIKGERVLSIAPQTMRPIPVPKNPYEF
ncbi:MAG: TIGR03943 family protein [Limnothrix sp. CACIAM 69d]|nr:MAG: TIGR03943 family protein [Limnothrix sp. CACIAM 69d]